MSKMYGLDILRYSSSLCFVIVLGILAFDASNDRLQNIFEFFLNGIFIIMLFSSGYLFVYNTDTFVKQDSVNYFVNRFKQLVPIYVICTLLAYVVAVLMNNTAVGLYNKEITLNSTSMIRDFLMIVDIQKNDFVYPIIYHAWPILVEMGMLYLTFFYLIFKENHKKRKLNDIYRDVLLFIAVVSGLSLIGINQFLALDIIGVPSLIKGIIFLFLNNNLLLLPFAIGMVVGLASKTKYYKVIPNLIKVFAGIGLGSYAIYLINNRFHMFLQGDAPLQINGGPKIYWLVPCISLLALAFVLLEPCFAKLFKKPLKITHYAYVQFLISDVVVYQIITYFFGEQDGSFSNQQKGLILIGLIVVMHIIAFAMYRVIYKHIFENRLFKQLPTDMEVDRYVEP